MDARHHAVTGIKAKREYFSEDNCVNEPFHTITLTISGDQTNTVTIFSKKELSIDFA